MDDRPLIDPLDEDTFDDRIIRHAPIRSTYSHISQAKWDKIFGKKWSFGFVWMRIRNNL